MNVFYIKTFGIFITLFSGILFSFTSINPALAAPTAETECTGLTPIAGECRDDIGNDTCAVGAKHAYGTCGTGKICCTSSGSVGSQCESSGRTGTCKENGGCNTTTEDDLGAGKDCQKGAPSLPDLTCCSSKDSSPLPANTSCAQLNCGNNVTGTCMPASPGCTSGLKPYGTCSSNAQGGSVCCIPESCTPTTAPTTDSTTASLTYNTLENLPGFEGTSSDLPTYLKNLYLLALWIVGICALFMLVIGGFLYLSSAGNTALIGSAKKTITGALIGLVIALITWLILNTINPSLTTVNLNSISLAGGSSSGGSTGGSTTPASGDVDKAGCEALSNNGVPSQCGLASKELVQVLSCMQGKGVKVAISSISASNIGSDQSAAAACCGDSRPSSCRHSKVTCHYGCTFGTKGLSYAADLATRGMTKSELCNVASIAKSCGGGNVWGPMTECGIVYEDGHGTIDSNGRHGGAEAHLHVSVNGCQH